LINILHSIFMKSLPSKKNRNL